MLEPGSVYFSVLKLQLSSTCRKSKPGRCKLIASKSTFLYAAVSRKIVLVPSIKAYTTILKDFMANYNGRCLIEINRVLT